MRYSIKGILATILCVLVLIMGPPGLGFAKAQAQQDGASAAQFWLDLHKDASSASHTRIMSFIRQHPDFPSLGRMRSAAEKAMPQEMPSAEALVWFKDHPPETLKGMTIYRRALQEAGRSREAQEILREWWPRARLSADEQDRAYSIFAKDLPRESHEQRLRRLIYQEQYTNARALAGRIGKGYRALTEARIALRENKGNASTLVGQVPSNLLNDEGLLFDRLQWRRKKEQNAGALEILGKMPRHEHLYKPDDWGRERGIMVRRLMEEKNYSLAYRVASRHGLKEGSGFANNEWVAGWLALEFLKKPYPAFEHFEKLYKNVETPISKSRAAYWAGLASERLGHKEIARQWYAVGAKYPSTFYGQLSAAKINVKPNFQSGTPASPSSLQSGALAQAAKWLKRNGYKSESVLFLNQMIDTAKTPADFMAVVSLSRSLSMENMAIKAAQEGEKKTGVEFTGPAFPRIENLMSPLDVEWALVHGLIRQESRYDKDAISSAGALGLMQLMPRTAEEVARKNKIPHNKSWLTSRPAHNVRLGTLYLKKLLDKYDGHTAMALAAYNAGPGRVDRWIHEIGDPRAPGADLIHWIELIPIYETRNYVQRVMEAQQVYRGILSKNPGVQAEFVTHIPSR